MSSPSWQESCGTIETAAEPRRGRRGDAGPKSIGRGIAWVLLSLIALYQRAVSPLTGSHCRFYPSCSSYAAEAIRRYGPFAGSLRAGKRIVRCHPFNAGGFDPVR